jgi:hypothetical protein
VVRNSQEAPTIDGVPSVYLRLSGEAPAPVRRSRFVRVCGVGFAALAAVGGGLMLVPDDALADDGAGGDDVSAPSVPSVPSAPSVASVPSAASVPSTASVPSAPSLASAPPAPIVPSATPATPATSDTLGVETSATAQGALGAFVSAAHRVAPKFS